MQTDTYKIGRGSVSNNPSQPAGVDYTPGVPLPICLWDYAPSGPEALGASLRPDQALKYEKHFISANAEWFLPFVERMAKGDLVTMEELKKCHRELFGEELMLVRK